MSTTCPFKKEKTLPEASTSAALTEEQLTQTNTSATLTKEKILYAWTQTIGVRAARKKLDIDAGSEAKELWAELEEEKTRRNNLETEIRRIRNPIFFIISSEEEFNTKTKQLEDCLEAGADINATDESGRTFLDYALQSSNFLFAIKLLILGARKAIDINTVNSDRKTLVEYAIDIGHFPSITILLSLNAKMNSAVWDKLQAVNNDKHLSYFKTNVHGDSIHPIFFFNSLIKAKQEVEKKKAQEVWKKAIEDSQRWIKTFAVSSDADPIRQLDRPEIIRVITKITANYDKKNPKDHAELESITDPMFQLQVAIKLANDSLFKELNAIFDGTDNPLNTSNPRHIIEFPDQYSRQRFCEILCYEKEKSKKLYNDMDHFISSLPKRIPEKTTHLLRDMFLGHLRARDIFLTKLIKLSRQLNRDYYQTLRDFGFNFSKNTSNNSHATKTYLLHFKNYFEGYYSNLKTMIRDIFGNNPAHSMLLNMIDHAAKSAMAEARNFSYSETLKGFQIKFSSQDIEILHLLIFREHFVTKLSLDLTVTRLRLVLNYLKHSWENDKPNMETAAGSACTATAASSTKAGLMDLAKTFAEVMADDRKTIKTAEQKAREERAIAQLMLMEKTAAEQEAIERRKYLEKTHTKEKTQVLEALKVKKLKDETILLCQILKKENLVNIKDKDLVSIFGEKEPNIPPFKIHKTTNGFMITLRGAPISTFDRQHGKPLHKKVFNEICAAFASLGITVNDLQDMLDNHFGNSNRKK